MSVQLSLLPQNFDGNYTSFTVQPNNLLNDAIQWNGIDAAVTTQYVMGSVAGALAFAARNAKTCKKCKKCKLDSSIY